MKEKAPAATPEGAQQTHSALQTASRADELQSHRKVCENQDTRQRFGIAGGKSRGVTERSSNSQSNPPTTCRHYLNFSPGLFSLSGLPPASEARRIHESFAGERIVNCLNEFSDTGSSAFQTQGFLYML